MLRFAQHDTRVLTSHSAHWERGQGVRVPARTAAIHPDAIYGKLVLMVDDIELGGDPPCWAHLFEDEETDGQEPALPTSQPGDDDAGAVDLAAVAQLATAPGAIWTRQSEDLNVNLLQFAAGEGVAEHLNTEVDVLLVGITGSGVITVDGARHVLHPGHALVIPKGTRRSTSGQSGPFAYLSCHRRRGGLRPGR